MTARHPDVPNLICVGMVNRLLAIGSWLLHIDEDDWLLPFVQLFRQKPRANSQELILYD
jgi:hypothetical protein